MRYLIGVDEAGRGPIAGPVSVGIVVVPTSFDFRLIAGVKDSKQCTEKEREAWYEEAKLLMRRGRLRFSTALIGSPHIDRYGINSAVRLGIRTILSRLAVKPSQCEVRLDGLLHAPKEFLFQKTIIRGDQTEPVISLASIVAKVRRDRLIKRLAEEYPLYGFERHKGYGTELHYERIKEHGLCNIHRRSYLKDLFPEENVV